MLFCMFFSNRFGKTKNSVRLNRLEKVIVDGSSFDGDRVFAVNYGYFEMHHEIIWNSNLFDSVIINRTI